MQDRRRQRTWVRAAGGAVVVGALLLGTVPVTLAQSYGHTEAASARMARVDADIAGALAQIERTEARKARIEAEIQGLSGRRAAAQRRLRTRTRALYRIGRAGMLPLAGGFDALLTHLGRLDRLERMVRDDVRSLSRLGTRGAALRAETGEVAAELESARGRLQGLQGQKVALEQEQRTAVSFDSVFGASPSQDSAGFGARLSHGSFRFADEPQRRQEAPIERMRGRLAMPVGGAVDIREGERDGARGVELQGALGAPVRAVFDGRVVFAERQGAYGRLVIVEHGQGYFSVYGGLGAMDVRAGDVLSRGAHLGVAGGSVFFGIRQGTRYLDASRWLGL